MTICYNSRNRYCSANAIINVTVNSKGEMILLGIQKVEVKMEAREKRNCENERKGREGRARRSARKKWMGRKDRNKQDGKQ